MSLSFIHSVHPLSSLSVIDITGKVVINIVKKHIEDNNGLTAEKHDTLITEIYFLSTETTTEKDVVKLIRY